MKKILIISYYFSPANMIGAVRPTKFAKFFSENGYDVTVLCSKENRYLFLNAEVGYDKTLETDVKDIKKIIISNSTMYKKFARILSILSKERLSGYERKKLYIDESKKSNIIKSFIKNSLYFFRYSFFLLQDLDFFVQSKKQLNKYEDEFDIVISSYSPFASHYIGSYYKNKQKDVFWISDFRDPVFNNYTPLGYKKFAKNFTKRVCKRADAITAVSNGCLESLYYDNHNNKHVITNGFDRSDLLGSFQNKEPNTVLKFVYTGALYKGKRDLRPIFRALNELINQRLISKEDIKIIYAGNSSEDFLEQINKYDLLAISEDKGALSRQQALELQLTADILMLSSWNEHGSEGNITGKFFEYIMMEKVIIATITGGLSDSYLKQMINVGNLGFCYEDACDSKDYIELKKYIYERYLEFKKEGIISSNPDTEFIEKFNYLNIIKQLEIIVASENRDN